MGLMVTVDPGSATVAMGGTQGFRATVLCGNQGQMENVTGASTIGWTLGGTVGTIAPSSGPSTTFAAHSNGTATLSVSAAYQGQSATGSAAITVGSAPPGNGTSASCRMLMVSLTPSSVVMGAGGTQSFTASVLCGSMMAMQDVTASSNLTWSGLSGLGSLNRSTGSSVDFRPTTAGNGTLWVTARYGTYSAHASAFLTVGPGSSKYFAISGMVTNATEGEVPGATVQVMGAPAGAIEAGGGCDGTGSFLFLLPANASYQLRALYPSGQVVDSSTIDLTGNRTVNLTLAKNTPIVPGQGTAGLPAWFLPVLIVVLFSITIVAIVGGGEVAQLALLFPSLLLYSRLKRDQVLDHFQRGRIYGYVEAHPGTCYTEILRGLHLANGVASYHLFTLEREQFVISRREGTNRRYYAHKAVPTEEGNVLSWVQDAILALVRQRPGIYQSEIARALGTRRQNVHYNVGRLEQAGLLRLEGWGLTKRCFATRDLNPGTGAGAAP